MVNGNKCAFNKGFPQMLSRLLEIPWKKSMFHPSAITTSRLVQYGLTMASGLILGLCPANERHRDKATASLIGWGKRHAQQSPPHGWKVGSNNTGRVTSITPANILWDAPWMTPSWPNLALFPVGVVHLITASISPDPALIPAISPGNLSHSGYCR